MEHNYLSLLQMADFLFYLIFLFFILINFYFILKVFPFIVELHVLYLSNRSFSNSFFLAVFEREGNEFSQRQNRL